MIHQKLMQLGSLPRDRSTASLFLKDLQGRWRFCVAWSPAGRDSLLFSLLVPSQEKLVEQDGGIGTLNPSWCLWEQPLFLQEATHPSLLLAFLFISIMVFYVSYWAWLAHGFTNCSNSNIRSTASKLVCSFRERKALRMHSTAVAASSCFKSG